MWSRKCIPGLLSVKKDNLRMQHHLLPSESQFNIQYYCEHFSLSKLWGAWESRALPWEAQCKHKAKLNKQTKATEAKSHIKPLAICIDIIAGVTTLTVLSVWGDFLLITYSKQKAKPLQRSHTREAKSSCGTGHELIRQNIWHLES